LLASRRYIVESPHTSNPTELDALTAAEVTRSEERRREALARAQALASAGDWAHATPFFRAALGEATDDVAALRGMGLAALHGGNFNEAVTWLSRAHRSAPYEVPVLSELGLAQKRAGRLGEAIESYRRALALSAHDTVLLVNLGRAEREAGRPQGAVLSFQRALAIDPSAAEVWSMLSNVLRESARTGDALDAARKALAIDPWLLEAHLNEGGALHAAGAPADALVSYLLASSEPRLRPGVAANMNLALKSPGVAARPVARLVLRLIAEPGDGMAWLELGRSQRTARPASALLCLEHALTHVQDASAERELAELYWDLGRVQPALERLLRSIASDRSDVRSYRLLAEWLSVPNKINLGSPAWQRLFAECPNDATSLSNLGVALRRRGYPIQAAALQRRALELEPRRVTALVNLGAALSSQGDIAGAITTYRRALELEPRHWDAASNLLFSLHLDPSATPESIFAEHVSVGADLAEAIPSAAPSALGASLEPAAGRRLRIGYVSPDLRSHPVAHFFEPVLTAHDRTAFEVFCYSDAQFPDTVTQRLAQLSEHFVPSASWSHEALRSRIAADRIDILVDLAGHTANNRLPVFAQRPCPVQIGWLGYFDTTGLRAVDYRIADAASVPPDAERYFVERVVRLPRSANCFLPPPGPGPSPAPASASGVITFGCFNNPAKIGRAVVKTFARVLAAVPRSRIKLKYLAFNEAALCERYRGWFVEEGIAPERVLFEGPSSLERFLEAFSSIDIALDPFPYSGETTALHTLWMGVPLVALEGPTLVQRLASRVLRIAGCHDWVAREQDDYVRIAAALASDIPHLERCRRTLREQLRASPLLDHVGVTRELEEAYRTLWRHAERGGRPRD
jgi:predicted O-linked N-acetylglucosamine transferase (SPINDLY family)